MSSATRTVAKFDVGRLRMTPAAADALSPGDVFGALMRHRDGDWGELDEWDAFQNDCALSRGEPLHSSYVDRKGIRFWIVTEGDRSSTTIMLPSEIGI